MYWCPWLSKKYVTRLKKKYSFFISLLMVYIFIKSWVITFFLVHQAISMDDQNSQSDSDFFEQNCECQLENGLYENFCFSSSMHLHNKIVGRRFDCNSTKYLRNFDLLDLDTAYDSYSRGQFNIRNLVFVTAASSNHFNESLLSLETIQKYYPNNKILYYNLGLDEAEYAFVDRLCNVELRTFDFEPYPHYMTDLFQFRWKPIIIAEVLKEYPLILWEDASSRFTNNRLIDLIADVNKGNASDFTILLEMFNPLYSMINPGVYEFLPMNVNRLKFVNERGANLMLIMKTTFTQRILKWSVLCALEEYCIAPQNTSLYHHYDINHKWRGWHRFDQAVFNILLFDSLNYDRKQFEKDHERFVWKHTDEEELEPGHFLLCCHVFERNCKET